MTRCPRCGGLMAAEAEWCGQCFQRLDLEGDGPEADTAPPADRRSLETPRPAGAEAPGGRARAAGPFEVEGDRVLWDCPACGRSNPLEASLCQACGTPFARLMEPPGEDPRRAISRGRATALSLVFPGLGHAAAGRRGEGLARAALFAWAVGSLITLVAVRAGRGLGALLVPVLLFLVVAAVIYAVTAIDAGRVAEGGGPVVQPRVLLYGVAGLMLLSVAVLFVVGVRATP